MRVHEVVKNLGGVISKNSPTLLTGLAVTGLITTTILAVKATPKALQLIEMAEYENKGQLTKREVVEVAWKPYIPAAAVGAASIACIIGANHISLRRNAAIASLYSLTDAAFTEYKAKVVETIGKNKEEKVRNEIAEEKVAKNPATNIIFTGKGEHLCYDSLSGRYFKSDIESIRRTVNKINHELMSEMFIPLNDVYSALGLAPVKLGEEIGLDIEKGLFEVSYSSHLTTDDVPCLCLEFEVYPRYKH